VRRSVDSVGEKRIQQNHMKTTLCSFARRATARIPAWAKAIRFVTNGIDGYPPHMPAELSVVDFLQNARELQLRSGAGEWDVLAYAVDHPDRKSRVVQPYGPENPYRKLRTDRGCRVKLIATFGYMRWTFFNFEASRTARTKRIARRTRNEGSLAVG